MKCWNQIALGEALDKPELSAAGYRSLDEWLDYTRRYGVVEYNSPTYYGVDLDALGLIARFAKQPAGRDAATRGLRYFWTEIAANWYQPGHRLGGAHSRDYDYLTGHGELDRNLVRAGWFDDPEMPETIFDQLCQWNPPAELHALALATPRTVYQRWGEEPSQWASQYVGRRYSIGVAGATYHNMDKPLAVNLPGGPEMPIVSFFLDGRDDPYGHERINTAGGHPKSLHLMPLLSSVQRGSEVLLLAADNDRTRKATKTEKYLTCLLSHVILPTAAELWVDDKRETFSTSQREVTADSPGRQYFARRRRGLGHTHSAGRRHRRPAGSAVAGRRRPTVSRPPADVRAFDRSAEGPGLCGRLDAGRRGARRRRLCPISPRVQPGSGRSAGR